MRRASTFVTTFFAVAIISGLTAGGVGAAVTPTSDAAALALSITGLSCGPDGPCPVTGAQLEELPPNSNPTAVSDSDLALFPLRGPNYAAFSTGDTNDIESPNDSASTSTDTGGGNGGHGGDVYDLVTLRIDLDVPASVNCMTVDYRFLTEEFEEFVGSDFNDAFLAELDGSSFMVDGSGNVEAPNNIAIGPDGSITTVNSAGTSADNAFGTTYDGATPVLRATTPVTAGEHSLYLSIYDASDAIYDSTVFIDNLKLRDVPKSNCKVGSADGPNEGRLCNGLEPTIYAAGGVAKGTDGDDVILGSGGSEVIRAGNGDDTICALGGRDVVRGQGGADYISGDRGDDDLRGNGGDDVILGGIGDDTISGQSGSDVLRGVFGDDALFGGNGNDKLIGARGDDKLRGRKGNDTLRGGRDNDDCKGGPGKDRRQGCERQ